jgi:hypothetical protein
LCEAWLSGSQKGVEAQTKLQGKKKEVKLLNKPVVSTQAAGEEEKNF